jgi:hypothetical protein
VARPSPIGVGAQLPQANQVVGELLAGPIPPLLGGRAGVGDAGRPAAAVAKPPTATSHQIRFLVPVVLAGRATSVPFTAVLAGRKRTTTDNTKAPSTCDVPCLRRWRSRPIWLCKQGVSENRLIPEPDSAQSAFAPTAGGLLANCWQLGPGRGLTSLFVLVGVVGFEPTISAVTLL